MIIEYKIAEATSIRDLDLKVNHFAKIGWKPQGGVVELVKWANTFPFKTRRQVFAQALVREQKENSADKAGE